MAESRGDRALLQHRDAPFPPPLPTLHPSEVYTSCSQGTRSRADPVACWLTFQHLAELFSQLCCELLSCVKAFIQIQGFQRTNAGKAVGNFGVVNGVFLWLQKEMPLVAEAGWGVGTQKGKVVGFRKGLLKENNPTIRCCLYYEPYVFPAQLQ